MKKVIFYIMLVNLFVIYSCNKTNQEFDTTNDIEESAYKFNEVINIYSSDSSSFASIQLLTNNKLLFDAHKQRLHLITEDCGTSSCSNEANRKVTSKTNNDEINGEIVICLLALDTEHSSIGIGLKDIDSNLKSQLPWKYSTVYDDLTEKKYPYQYVKYYYKTNDDYGISVEFGYKNCWLCGWNYPISYEYYFYGQDDDLEYVGNPKNAKSKVYKLGARVISNLSDGSNFYYWPSKVAYPE